jgi:hypothetical protein
MLAEGARARSLFSPTDGLFRQSLVLWLVEASDRQVPSRCSRSGCDGDSERTHRRSRYLP